METRAEHLDANYWRVRRLADLIEILGFKDRQ
jgi:hypothetical protein